MSIDTSWYSAYSFSHAEVQQLRQILKDEIRMREGLIDDFVDAARTYKTNHPELTKLWYNRADKERQSLKALVNLQTKLKRTVWTENHR